MNIVIVGCGKVGMVITKLLSSEDHNITLVDEDSEAIAAVTNHYDAMGVIGNGVSYQSLLEAGIKECDLFIAVTDSSEANIFACLAAKRFGVHKTIADVENIDYISMAEGLDIGTVLNKKTITAISKAIDAAIQAGIGKFFHGAVDRAEGVARQLLQRALGKCRFCPGHRL